MLDKLLITEELIDDDFELIIELMELIEMVAAEELETDVTEDARLWFELLVFPVVDELVLSALSPEAPHPAKYREIIMHKNLLCFTVNPLKILMLFNAHARNPT
jgi:hypothetical protein